MRYLWSHDKPHKSHTVFPLKSLILLKSSSRDPPNHLWLCRDFFLLKFWQLSTKKCHSFISTTISHVIFRNRNPRSYWISPINYILCFYNLMQTWLSIISLSKNPFPRTFSLTVWTSSSPSDNCAYSIQFLTRFFLCKTQLFTFLLFKQKERNTHLIDYIFYNIIRKTYFPATYNMSKFFLTHHWEA